MPQILILTNSINGLYSFRRELIEELLKRNINITISAPTDSKTNYFIKNGCNVLDTRINRRGANPFSDLKLLLTYLRILKENKPDIVLTYTIKPNIYGGLACRIKKIHYITNITGLGTAIENRGLLQKIIMVFYKIALKNSDCIYFQNNENRKFMQYYGIGEKKSKLIPGSGVNINQHEFECYPSKDINFKFLFIGRLMKAKGIEDLFKAIEYIKEIYPKVEFHIVGSKEERFDKIINNLINRKLLIYHGVQSSVHKYIANAHAVIIPSHHEGMSNVLLEAASTGRPVLASKIPGCVEGFDEGISGLGFLVKNPEDLISVIIKFIELPYEKKREMGIAGRLKVEKEFDRNIIVEEYINQINLIKEL